MGVRKNHSGIEVRHLLGCATRAGKRCSCAPTYRVVVWSSRDQRKLTRTFKNRDEARSWQIDAQAGLRHGTVRAGSVTVREAAEAWVAGAATGSVRNRSGDIYKPGVVRSYAGSLRLRVLPDLGARRLTDVERSDLQRLVDRMVVAGDGASTIRNALMPVRAIYRRALVRGEVAVNPTTGLELPAVRGTRDRVANPEEAKRLLDALQRDRALWATALFAGLRRGELRALRWETVDFDRGVIRVVSSWDRKAGAVAPKSRAGLRTVPMASALRMNLVEHRRETGRATGLVFGRTAELAFDPSAVSDRANKAWAAAGLTRIGLHECRHTFASLMIAAGVNAKALATYMGHASVTITFDLYGHLMPGNEEEAAGLLDALLEGPTGSAAIYM